MVRRRNRLGLAFVVLLAVVAGIGFYRNWFALSSSRAADSNKVNVNLSVDPDKMRDDARRAAEVANDNASKLGGKIKQEATDLKHRTARQADGPESNGPVKVK